MISIEFVFLTGLKTDYFSNARLSGDWNNWQEIPMQSLVADDGCSSFVTTVTFPDSRAGQSIRWGVRLDAPSGPNAWAINLEVHDAQSQQRYRTFTLPSAGTSSTANYYFTDSRRLGAQKVYPAGGGIPGIRFAVWAPNARVIDVVFSTIDHGYISYNGAGIDPTMPVISLSERADGIWESAIIPNFDQFIGKPYMFRIKNAQNNLVYRTDIHSRWQLGRGGTNPQDGGWNGDPKSLDGTVSCSVVIDQDIVRAEFEPTTNPPTQVSDEDFWSAEFTPSKPVPTRLDDLIIYELHLGSLGFGRNDSGTLSDAMALLDQLSELGINAVELLPVSEFSGNIGWGYGDTHHFVIESSAGGRDKYKHFVRACHQRGIAVLQDVVYNHYDGNAERAEWQYDSTKPEENIYYWYEGQASDYPYADKGYLDNGSTGYTPRFWEERVRQLFISSAAEFVSEFHVDGLRVDLTQAIHRDNALHRQHDWEEYIRVPSANLFGQKFLREWSRTLKLIRPSIILIAEDHTGWEDVTKMPNVGGLGFDATWFAEFYHQLIGDSDMANGKARLLHEAGLGFDGDLRMDEFSGHLWNSQYSKVCYHESHDEAGNAGGSLRTSKVAVNDAALIGVTRKYAEARSRVAFGLSLLSAGTPMFFMGEEIVAQKISKYNNAATSKEDLIGDRAGIGAKMFRFYQDLIRLRRNNSAVRSRSIDILYAWNPTRVIAFTRRHGHTDVLIVASFNNSAFSDGYELQTESHRLPDGLWQETFNSDAAIYGGDDVGNYGTAVACANGRIRLRIPANGFLVLQRR